MPCAMLPHDPEASYSYLQVLSNLHRRWQSLPVSPFPSVSGYCAELAACRIMCCTNLACLRYTLRNAGTKGIDACEDKRKVYESCNDACDACEGKDMDLSFSKFANAALQSLIDGDAGRRLHGPSPGRPLDMHFYCGS